MGRAEQAPRRAPGVVPLLRLAWLQAPVLILLARRCCIELVRGRYADFGPTLAHEKLLELHQIPVSLSTARSWMIGDGVWISARERKKRVQQPRYRCACLGGLVQIDGSDHDWFAGPAPLQRPLYIDDAAGRLMELRFVRSESTFEYFEATNSYLRRHGKPVAFYSDKASIFRVNAKDPKRASPPDRGTM
jgi:hypothetical protein